MLNHFQRQFSYNAWANRETLASLQAMRPAPPKGLRHFGHILAAERLWQERLNHRSTKGFVVWPEWSLEQCAIELDRVIKDWNAYLAGLTTEMLLRSVRYMNSKGEEWQNTVTDILTHLIIHSGYHRGQVAADVRAAGGEPAYTDYIHAIRRGWVDGHGAR